MVPRLADAAAIDEVLFAGVELDLVERLFRHGNPGGEKERFVGVAEKTDRRVLVGEAGCGVGRGHDVTPFVRGIESGVDHGEVADDALQAE